MRIAMILNGKAHWIFTADVMPDWPPGQEGNPVELVDITGKPEICEGWDYDTEIGEFSPPMIMSSDSTHESG